mmetsp:Transcript_57992/g.114142  ORF Transcript_57992/g.114142 Transcript_57992/m.114142 type:complete len:104 (+) Transcript_57992:111-422(+)
MSLQEETAVTAVTSADFPPVDAVSDELGWFTPWKCGLCETWNSMDQEGHSQHFCNTCARDRTVEFKWIYSFKKSTMYLKKYKPFVEPAVSWQTAAVEASTEER